jgi:uncharacterized protein (TIGR03435 family)
MMVTFGMADRSRIIAQQVTMQALAENLGSEMRTIVTDATRLTAKYDFTLTYASPKPQPPPAHMPLTFGRSSRICDQCGGMRN